MNPLPPSWKSLRWMFVSFMIALAALAKEPLVAPIAPIEPVVSELHGEKWTDEYSWLRKREDPRVRAYLDAENAYTETRTAHTEPLEEQLYREMLGRIVESDATVPELDGDWFYYQRTEAGKAYPILCRKRSDNPAARERIMLDVNELAPNGGYCSIGQYEMNPAHTEMGIGIDRAGDERFALHFRDPEGGVWLPDAIANTDGKLAWSTDGKSVFYTALDDAFRPCRVYRHILGQPVENDQLVYEEKDAAYRIEMAPSRDRNFVIIVSRSQTTTECRIIPSDRPDESPQVVAQRREGIEYTIDHQGGRFFILTNDDAINFRVMTAPVANPSREHWREYRRHDDGVYLTAMLVFEKNLVLLGLRKLEPVIWNYDLEKDLASAAGQLAEAAWLWPERNPDFRSTSLRYGYSTITKPDRIVDMDMNTGEAFTRKVKRVTGYDDEQYMETRIVAKTPDETAIPITIAWKGKDSTPPNAPTLLYGYGAYGYPTEPWFDPNVISLLDRGFVFAIAHVRGGGELGRQWYLDGKLDNKLNTFNDFIACAEHLIETGYADRNRLAIYGASAGGLLIGTVVNQRPDLFRAAIAEVPFVDVINTMLDASVPLTATEWQEWGDPRQKHFFDYMRSYSPYDNVKRSAILPDLLILAGWNDSRVGYWEPAKWTARLRVKNPHAYILLKTQMDSGHDGVADRYQRLRETAFQYAFLIDRMKD